MTGPVRGPLPHAEYASIFSRVPRLTVEVVIFAAERGVLLTLREIEPCIGLWHLPGGTVRFGEPVTDAVARVAEDELGLAVRAGDLLGYIEYPSHYEHGLDSPSGWPSPPSRATVRPTRRRCAVNAAGSSGSRPRSTMSRPQFLRATLGLAWRPRPPRGAGCSRAGLSRRAGRS